MLLLRIRQVLLIGQYQVLLVNLELVDVNLQCIVGRSECSCLSLTLTRAVVHF